MKLLYCLVAMLMLGMFDGYGHDGGAESVELKLGQEQLIKSAGVRVRFVELAEDSRCPQGVNCIWAGNVRVVLQIKGPGRTSRREALNTATEPNMLKLKNRTLSILKVTPPKIIDQEIKPRDYRITLSVK